MAMIRCERGEHVYDSDKHFSCPYCRQMGDGVAPTLDVNVPTQDVMAGRMAPSNRAGGSRPGAQETEGLQLAGGANKTVGFYADPDSDEKIFDPVVGWVAVISKVNRGTDFRLRAGYNMVGRDMKSDIFIDFDSMISRTEHAAVIYDPKNSSFFVQHMKGHNPTYLNGSILLQPANLKPYDVITVGATELVFVPLCGVQFRWEDEASTQSATFGSGFTEVETPLNNNDAPGMEE